ncbi:MAG: adenylate/guanylate cyclase domain-containing protein [Geminicoccaceae bacterium]
MSGQRAGDLVNGRILVAEDDPDVREILVFMLAREGWSDVDAVGDGDAAVAALGRRAYDLVLLDVMMPGRGGIEVLDWIKADPGLRHIPVIIVTALGDLDLVAHCVARGAEDRLTKPVEPVLLRARVAAGLERKRLHDREQAHLLAIERERARADELLQAILPAAAVDELKATNRVRPRRFDEVVILFADVVGFTAFCDSHPAEEAVRNLEDLVEWFEALADLHGLEKIKTVGDAFFATGNLLVPRADAAIAAVRCALAMADAAGYLPVPWTIRTAIHVGPVVGGVLGSSKYSFDLWGDTVNVAARLAAAGLPPGTYCTAEVWRRLAGRARGRSLGPMPVKGKGTVEVWRCEGLAGS